MKACQCTIPFQNPDACEHCGVPDYSEINSIQQKWCPQHGYPEPCIKCSGGMTIEEWDKFYKRLEEVIK